ncbi:MAG: tetratricopeptide repeat protein, partial [Saccharothrix sp.]|nr:tetratricopeptide repeat protein [Saccharothrix sp.]
AVELLDRVPANRRCLIVLSAAAERHEHVRQVLFDLVTRDPGLAALADTALLELVVRHAPHETCVRVLDGQPRSRLDVADVVARLARRVVDELPRDTPPAERARLLSTLVVSLGAVDDHQGAVAPAREADRIMTRLGARTGEAAIAALNLGRVLLDAKRLAEAVEPTRRAADVFTALQEQYGGHLVYVAHALNQMAGLLSAAGDPAEAVRYGELAVAALRKSGTRAQVADTLNTLGRDLLFSGRHHEAVARSAEAVELARLEVAEDRTAHLDLLARCVRALAVVREYAGDREGAVAAFTEVVDLSRELARSTALRLPGLASDLDLLGLALSHHDKGRALTLAREAVGIRRELVATRADEHLADLAASLRHLAEGQVVPGARSDALPEALDAAREAVRIHDGLAARGRSGVAGSRRGALSVLVKVLTAMGRLAEAARVRSRRDSTARAERPNG